MNNSVAIQEKVFSRKEAAEFLGVYRTTLDRMDLPRTKVRRRVFFRQTELIRWLEENAGGKGAKT